jgi:hypothetical protein
MKEILQRCDMSQPKRVEVRYMLCHNKNKFKCDTSQGGKFLEDAKRKFMYQNIFLDSYT